MLSIAVCDDEVLDCCRIAKHIGDILEEMKVPCSIRRFESGKALLQASEDFDIIFLDILMCELDGMKTAQLLRGSGFEKILIFVSSSREYVFDAYDVEAFQYLPKPVDMVRLERVLRRAVGKTGHDTDAFLLIRKDRQKMKLYLKDIYYFEVRGRIISVHAVKGVCDYYEKIGVLEENLRDRGFFRCHKSFLINLSHVDAYNRQEAVLENGEKIAIAKRRYDAFCRAFLAHMKECQDGC